MKYDLMKRISDLYSLLAACFLPVIILFLVNEFIDSYFYFIIIKLCFISLYICILVNNNVLNYIGTAIPSLTLYVIRFSISGFLLILIPFHRTLPEDGAIYYASVISIVVGVLFIMISKIGAIFGGNAVDIN